MNFVIQGIESMIRDHNHATEGYFDLKEKLEQRYGQDEITGTYFKQTLDEFKENYLDYGGRVDGLAEQLETATQAAIEKTRTASTVQVTADEVAELKMLGELEDLTGHDLDTYANKYQDKPLALRQIRNIAKRRNVNYILPEHIRDKVDPIDGILKLSKMIETVIDYYRGDHVSDVMKRSTYDMVTAGHLERLKEIEKLIK